MAENLSPREVVISRPESAASPAAINRKPLSKRGSYFETMQ